MTIDTARTLAARHGGQIEREIDWLVERMEGLEEELRVAQSLLAYHERGDTARDLAEACRQLRAADVENAVLKEASGQAPGPLGLAGIPLLFGLDQLAALKACAGAAINAWVEDEKETPADQAMAALARLLIEMEDTK